MNRVSRREEKVCCWYSCAMNKVLRSGFNAECGSAQRSISKVIVIPTHEHKLL